MQSARWSSSGFFVPSTTDTIDLHSRRRRTPSGSSGVVSCWYVHSAAAPSSAPPTAADSLGNLDTIFILRLPHERLACAGAAALGADVCEDDPIVLALPAAFHHRTSSPSSIAT